MAITRTRQTLRIYWIAAFITLSSLSPNVAAACNLTITAQEGDTCASLAATWGITVTAFIHNNPAIQSCSKLAVGSPYCIDADSLPLPQPAPAATKSSNSPASASASASAPSTVGGNTVSPDGTCGNGTTCSGSKYGTCCSAHGWCGSSADHCGAGCLADFGSCSVAPSTGESNATSAASTPGPAPPAASSTATTSSRTVATEITQVKTAWTTMTTTTTQTIKPVTTVVTSTHTETAVFTVSTVLTSTVATQTHIQSITRTTTRTQFNTSVITTITTLTLVLSITDKTRIAELCSRTLLHTARDTPLSMPMPTTTAAVPAANQPDSQRTVRPEPCCRTETVHCAASTPGANEAERSAMSAMASRAALSMPGMDVCCGVLYSCL